MKAAGSIEADFDRLALLDEEGWTANNHYHRALLKRVPQGCENALEIGCGTGAFARALAKISGRVVALDLSAEMIRVARVRATRVHTLEFHVADAMTWNFPQAHFDFMCSIATLHHTPQRELLIKMRDALKPGGVLAILDLVQSSGLAERVIDVLGFGVSGTLRLVHNRRLHPPPEVRKAWEQHGHHDSYLTIDEVRKLADEILPGANVRRCLLWRYELVYRKPVRDLGE